MPKIAVIVHWNEPLFWTGDFRGGPVYTNEISRAAHFDCREIEEIANDFIGELVRFQLWEMTTGTKPIYAPLCEPRMP